MSNRLNGKVALVTGAASGMGREIAMEFLQEGAKVMAVDLNLDGLKELYEDVKKEGLEEGLRIAKCNITVYEDCENAVKTCVEAFGTMNVLSHNAGVADNFKMVHAMDMNEWNRMLNINLTGSMLVAKAALNYFLPNEIKASMVMVTSNAAFESATGGPAYSASKAGANALMKSIAFEYARKGIRCNSICPGPVMTNIALSQGEWDDEGSEVHAFSGYTAHQMEWTGIATGKASDIAPLAVYLASDESVFVNSSSIVIDGGVCLSR